MPKLGLALSGGGFRATLYHLGVVRFLRDSGALQDVTDIASVSGGSILAAHLVLNWDRYNGDDASFDAATDEVVKFVQFDLRNHIVRRLPMQFPLRLLAKLRFIDGRDHTPDAILQRYYKKFLYGDRCLYELPASPALHMLATNVSTGALSVFNRNGLYVQHRGDGSGQSSEPIPGQMATIARVVAASSAFPGFFPPVEMTAADLGVRDGQFPTEYFTDGGVFDNLGVRAFLWLKQQGTTFDRVLVSDAGKPFQILSDAALGVLGQSVRATDILWDRVWQLERENFGHEEGFVFLPITESVDLSEDGSVQHPVVQAEVQSIRTDLDRFSEQEINSLARHGYEVARKLCRRDKIFGERSLPDSPPWTPISRAEPPATTADVPGPHGPAVSTQLSRQLRGSSGRRVWSTLLDWRDWPSYLYLALALFLFCYLPLQVYQLHRKSVEQGEIIGSITKGDADIAQILKLAASDPLSDWTSEEVLDKPQPTEVSFEGIELLSHSRMYDLRGWFPDEESPDKRGHVYIRDRITLQLLTSYQGDARVTFRLPSKVEEIHFRKPNDDPPCVISRVSEPVEVFGRERTLYEIEYDLSQFPTEEPVTIELEVIGDYPKSVRAPLLTHSKTDLISVWMLFPPDRPYRTYSLVSYPVDRSESPRVMHNRFSIDHPYGFLIGWSVVDPEENRVYECRWTYD
jgi:predicted acylesterase/phospholipase RssA